MQSSMKEVEALAHEFVAAFNGGRGTDRYRRLLAPGSSFENMGFGLAARAPSQLSALNQAFSEAVPDLRFDLARVTAGAAGFVVEGDLQGTLRGPLLGHAPTQRTATVAGAISCDVEEDRIKNVRLYFDGLAAAKQWGLHF